jgi:hypothetical protein
VESDAHSYLRKPQSTIHLHQLQKSSRQTGNGRQWLECARIDGRAPEFKAKCDERATMRRMRRGKERDRSFESRPQLWLPSWGEAKSLNTSSKVLSTCSGEDESCHHHGLGFSMPASWPSWLGVQQPDITSWDQLDRNCEADD